MEWCVVFPIKYIQHPESSSHFSFTVTQLLIKSPLLRMSFGSAPGPDDDGAVLLGCWTVPREDKLRRSLDACPLWIIPRENGKSHLLFTCERKTFIMGPQEVFKHIHQNQSCGPMESCRCPFQVFCLLMCCSQLDNWIKVFALPKSYPMLLHLFLCQCLQVCVQPWSVPF